ncbi:MAG TPA: LmbU family transcriptional regulator [Pseudonocardiaceae bacterium]|nr:LmbU family transcriptional regulator [Pseudonocardiaceae bacterium]
MRIPEDLDYDGWARAGQKIARAADMFAWCIGDWLAFGEDRYTDRYRHAVDAAGLNYQTLRNYAWVARRFDISRRRPALSVQHHIEVAALPAAEQEHWLHQAEQLKWSRNELRKRIRQYRKGRSSTDAEQLSMPLSMPRIQVSSTQLQLWHHAAEQDELDFQTWVITALDRYASGTVSGDS